MNIFNKQEITTGDRIVAYIDGKCFIRDGRGKPETLVVENFRLDDRKRSIVGIPTSNSRS